MIKSLKILYHFIGSLTFAITLISTTALTVVLGTVLESSSGSHLYAAHFTYASPFFFLLLCLFFANILISALRRWPFKLRHIPFLITHLGLLMIISGTMIKNIWGTQGNMPLIEGAGSQTLLIPNTQVVSIERRDENDQDQIVRTELDLLRKTKSSDNINLKVVGYAPHSIEKFSSWFKKDLLVIYGLPPFQVTTLKNVDESIPVSGRARFAPPPELAWNVVAVRSEEPLRIAQNTYIEGLKVKVSTDKQFVKEVSIKETLKNNNELNARLDFNSLNPQLHFTFPNLSEKDDIALSLMGDGCLVDMVGTSTHEIDLERDPTLLFIEDPKGDIHFYAFDSYGQILCQTFDCENLSSLVVYDQGFHGYARQAVLPLHALNQSRRHREDRMLSAFLHNQGVEVPTQTPEGQTIALETTILPVHISQPSKAKWEENIPKVNLLFDNRELISLAYDRNATGLKWPTSDSRYLLRFQPHLESIPYRVRLREARQINYPQTNQPYSYEADVIIDNGKNEVVETTLSMNQVHETWDGYRFYLANISSSKEGGIKHIQLIVNHDPAKYFFTYPGALLVAFGIVSLFWIVLPRKRST